MRKLLEMVTLADRILVMHEFAIVSEYVNDRRYEHASRAIMSAIHAGRENSRLAIH